MASLHEFVSTSGVVLGLRTYSASRHGVAFRDIEHDVRVFSHVLSVNSRFLSFESLPKPQECSFKVWKDLERCL